MAMTMTAPYHLESSKGRPANAGHTPNAAETVATVHANGPTVHQHQQLTRNSIAQFGFLRIVKSKYALHDLMSLPPRSNASNHPRC
jgi:hypothetical protein